MPKKRSTNETAVVRTASTSTVTKKLRKNSTVPISSDKPQQEHQQKNLPNSTKKGSIRPNVIRVYESNLHFSVFCQWPEKRFELEDAPEILILFKRPTAYMFTSHDTFLLKFLSCFGRLCQNRIHAYFGLANFKPLVARTNHTIEYVEKLMKSYSNASPSPSLVSSFSITNTKGGGGKRLLPKESKEKQKKKGSGSSSNKNGSVVVDEDFSSKQQHHRNSPSPQHRHPYLPGSKQHLLQDFYKTAHRTLQYLQNGITLYKQILLTMSFTRYAKEDLTHTEIKLTRGKSIIGSCMWLVTYAIQQMQEDPDVEQWGGGGGGNSQNLDPQLLELATEVLMVVTLIYHTWSEMVNTVGVLEKMHRKTEALFLKQTNYFHSMAPPDSEHAIATSVHLKKYRRSESDSLNLRRFDPSSVPLYLGKKHAYPRILYKTDYAKRQSHWRGFDPLSVEDKMAHLKDILKFVKSILESVKDSAKQIVEALQGSPNHQEEQQQEKRSSSVAVNHRIQMFDGGGGITCYEDGLDLMDELLTKKLAHIDWSPKEVQEFFETDKIFLDDMDLLTLGAGVTRAILHDSRRTMHICYETSRLVDFKEFINLPDYQKVYKTVKEEKEAAGRQQQQQQQQQQRPSKTNSILGGGNGGRASGGSQEYDIEELTLELNNVSDLFRNSPYYEIIKSLPIYCSQVGITLQDAELVFTPSSEKLLSKPVTMRSSFS